MSVLQNYRNVTIAFTGGAFPPDAYKAALRRVEQLEELYSKNSSLADLGTPAVVDPPAAAIPAVLVLTGTAPYKVYVFEVLADFSAATYAFEFIEEAPNVETATAL